MSKVLKFLEVKREEDSNVPGGGTAYRSQTELYLTNHDLKVVEPARRQWRARNFVAFWLADSININTWMIIASSIEPPGLAWWEAFLCVWVGYFIVGGFIVLSGRMGAVNHIGFPVLNRASFGIWGALWPVFNRGAMACIWYGVQSWIGGQCVVLMFRAIGPSYNSIPNGIPKSGTTTKDFVGFFVFSALSLIAIWFPVEKIRHLFTVKAYFVPVAAIVFFIWALVKAHGIGPVVHQPATISGSSKAWLVVMTIMNCISNFATLILNDADFTRFAATPSSATWSQFFTIPFGFALTSFVGVIVSSSSVVIYNQPIWNPLDLLGLFLDHSSSGGTRFGVFFIAIAFALAQLGVNIAANSVSAGSDLTALMPRFINIRRGGYLCALIGFVMCPWNLLSSSNNFTSYLSSYSTFLSSIIGVQLCDYYIVRKGYLEVNNLFSASKSGPYWYNSGVNWRAYVAYILGIVINLPGFISAVHGPETAGGTYIYRLNFFTGLAVSMGSYYICCRLSPIPACSKTWHEVSDNIVYDAEQPKENGSDYDEKEKGPVPHAEMTDVKEKY